MTDQVTQAGTLPATVVPGTASVGRLLRDQRKTVVVAVLLAAAVFWVAGPLGEWRLAACLAAGVGLGLVNHLATEWWLLRTITSGAQPTRGSMVAATITRLVLLTAVAVAIAVVLWPAGAGLLLGLAIFRLIALVMTGLPLLKELKAT